MEKGRGRGGGGRGPRGPCMARPCTGRAAKPPGTTGRVPRGQRKEGGPGGSPPGRPKRQPAARRPAAGRQAGGPEGPWKGRGGSQVGRRGLQTPNRRTRGARRVANRHPRLPSRRRPTAKKRRTAARRVRTPAMGRRRGQQGRKPPPSKRRLGRRGATEAPAGDGGDPRVTRRGSTGSGDPGGYERNPPGKVGTTSWKGETEIVPPPRCSERRRWGASPSLRDIDA